MMNFSAIGSYTIYDPNVRNLNSLVFYMEKRLDTLHHFDIMDSAENKREYDRQRTDRKGERTQLQMAIEHTGTKVYHLRVSHSTVVGAYDAIEAFGGTIGNKSVPQILVTLITESVATLRRDGHIPDRPPAEIVDKLAQIVGDISDVSLPSMSLQPTPEPPTDLDTLIKGSLLEVTKPVEKPAPAYQVEPIEITGVAKAISEEEEILTNKNDPLVQEVMNLATPESKQALLEAYTQLRKEQWGTPTARALYEHNLANKE